MDRGIFENTQGQNIYPRRVPKQTRILGWALIIFSTLVYLSLVPLVLNVDINTVDPLQIFVAVGFVWITMVTTVFWGFIVGNLHNDPPPNPPKMTMTELDIPDWHINGSPNPMNG